MLLVYTMSNIKLPLQLAEYFDLQESSELPEALAPLHEALYPIQTLTISGVYFLVQDGVVVYVGQSTNLAHRIVTGHPEKVFDSAYCLLVPTDKLREVELAFIAVLNPIYNQTDGPKNSPKMAQTLQILDLYGWDVEDF